MSRPTIRDIAAVAGVSPTAVSFALNSRPGISPATRQRIITIADHMGWTPNAAARSLSASKAHAVGLVIARPQNSYVSERFFFQLMVGLQARLKQTGLDLVLQMTDTIPDEMAVYRAWAAQRRVDGVICVDPRFDDPRPALLTELDLPAVFVGEPVAEFGAVIGNDEAMIRMVAQHLVDAGASRIGYLCGLTTLVHTQRRTQALSRFGAQHGIDIMISAETDFTESSGLDETAQLLSSPTPPDAIIFDNEVLALGGAQAIRARGLRLGYDVLTVSCEDSIACRILEPPMTAVAREPSVLGEHAAQVLHAILHNEEPRSFVEAVPELIIRRSTHPSEVSAQ